MTQLREALAVLAAGWPQKLDRDAVAVYAEMLADVPPEELLTAVKRSIATDEHRPSVARLRRMVVERREQIPTVTQAAAQAALLDEWSEAAAIPVGAGRAPQRPVTHPLVDATWAAVGTDHAPSFARAYRESVDLHVTELIATRLDQPQLEAGG